MKIIRYFFVGGVAAAVDITLFALLTKEYMLPWFPVAIFSFILATIVNYTLSVRFVFDSGARFTKKSEVFLVFIVSACGLIINQGILWIFIEMLFLDLILSKIIATGSVFFWNYLLRKHIIFKEKNERSIK